MIYLEPGDWPGGVSVGLILDCARCGQEQFLDYTVSDDCWESLTSLDERRSVVCLRCLLNSDSRYVLANLERVQIIGSDHTLVLVPSLLVPHSRVGTEKPSNS